MPGLGQPSCRGFNTLRRARNGRLATTVETQVLRRKRGRAPKVRQCGRHGSIGLFVGIEDWALRKGQRYGTIVVDLERGRVVDLLPDRDADTVKKWLEQHPGVEVITRDRWPSYARAASEAAPQARQVIDRWHLLKNLREAIERLFDRHVGAVAEALKSVESDPPTDRVHPAESPTQAAPQSSQTEAEAAPISPRQQAREAKRRRHVERFKQVHELRHGGISARRIAQELGLARCTVRRYLASTAWTDERGTRGRASQWEEHREWIDSRLADGDCSAAELHRGLAARVRCPPKTGPGIMGVVQLA